MAAGKLDRYVYNLILYTMNKKSIVILCEAILATITYNVLADVVVSKRENKK